MAGKIAAPRASSLTPPASRRPRNSSPPPRAGADMELENASVAPAAAEAKVRRGKREKRTGGVTQSADVAPGADQGPPRRTRGSCFVRPHREAGGGAESVLKTPVRSAAWLADWAAREKQYSKEFGPACPKGKVLLAEGAYAPVQAGVGAGLCVLQYAPRAGRMSWLYVTHGLSQCCIAGAQTACRLELAVHWKQHDNQLPVRILLRVSRQLLAQGVPEHGALISPERAGALRAAGMEHWLACLPDKSLPECLESARLNARLLLLVGITEAEFQAALKVKAGLADGRKVLEAALHSGGVFPVSDTTRGCITRRRDFHRLWESAFHQVRSQAKQ